MRYSEIKLWRAVRLDDSWKPNNGAITPDREHLKASDGWTITREPGEEFYVVSSPTCGAHELHASNVRFARLEVVAEKKGAKRV